jgi:hypothetical protein
LSSGLIGIVRANADLQTEVDDLDDLPVLTGGIAVDAGLDDKRPLDATILVRPVSLDSLTISGGDWKPLGINNCPVADEVLAAGRTCTTWLTGHSTSGAITVEAFLWGRKISRTVLPDPTAARHIARELSLESGVFDDEMQTQIDRAAFALNNVWSLIAVWGGSGGYSDVGGWGLGLSGIGGGGWSDSVDTTDVGTFGHIGSKLDLRPQLAPVVEKCGARTAFKIWLETTRDEIVAVDVDAPKETEPVRHCLEDAVWELALAIPDPDAMSHLNTMTEFAAR